MSRDLTIAMVTAALLLIGYFTIYEPMTSPEMLCGETARGAGDR